MLDLGPLEIKINDNMEELLPESKVVKKVVS